MFNNISSSYKKIENIGLKKRTDFLIIKITVIVKLLKNITILSLNKLWSFQQSFVIFSIILQFSNCYNL